MPFTVQNAKEYLRLRSLPVACTSVASRRLKKRSKKEHVIGIALPLSAALSGPADAVLGGACANVVREGFDTSYNFMETSVFTGMTDTGRQEWLEMVAFLSECNTAESLASSLIDVLDRQWIQKDQSWVWAKDASLITIIQGRQVQLDLTALSQTLGKRNWRPPVWEKESGKLAGSIWVRDFEAVSNLIKNRTGKEPETLFDSIEKFCSICESMYRELSEKYSGFGHLVAATNLKILFSGPRTTAQAIHLDGSRLAFIFSAVGAFTAKYASDRSITNVHWCKVVAGTVIKVFPGQAHLRYDMNSKEFNLRPWYCLDTHASAPVAVKSGTVLVMLPTMPHGGPARMNKEVKAELTATKAKGTYTRFTLFRMFVPPGDKQQAVEAVVTVDGEEAQNNNWNHLRQSEGARWVEKPPKGWTRAEFVKVYNAADSHGFFE